MLGVYNDWPASANPVDIDIDPTFAPCGAHFPGGVKSGDVAFLFDYLITQLHTRVERMMVQLNGEFGYGCYGYSYRAGIHDPSVINAHAAGIGIDYNGPKHTRSLPDGGWSEAQSREIRLILRECSDAIIWTHTDDPMHFEISGTPNTVAAAAGNIPGIHPPKPTLPLPKPPEPEYEPITITQSMTGAY